MSRKCLALFVGVVGCSSAAGQEEGPAEPIAAEPPAESDRATRVEVATIGESSASIRVQLPGEVEGKRDATLAASLGGYIERVLVEVGDEVRQGQRLIQVDAATHRARASQARVELEAAQREHDRAQRLGAAIAAAQRDEAESRLAAARAAQRIAGVGVSRSVIRAPFAGTVAELDAEVGEVAAPGQPLLRLVVLDPVTVSLAVPDRDVVALQEGLPARVRANAQAQVFEGAVSHIHRAADTDTRAFTVEVDVPNPDKALLPGMIANVTIENEVSSAELLVPQDFVVTGLEGLGVFLEDGGTVIWRPLQLGRVVRNQVVVESGLNDGDRVVITGQRELVENDAVIVVREGQCCTGGRVTF